MAYRFLLEVPELVHEDAKIAIEGVRDARILIERHPNALNPDEPFAELTVVAHSLDVIDALFAWMHEDEIKQDVYLAAYEGERVHLPDFDARSLRRRIQGDQYWMETTVPRIAHVDSSIMEGGARVADVPYGGRTTSTVLLPAETDVRITGIDHIAVKVRDMARAEQFYREFFGMAVSYRALRDGDRWQHLDAEFDWVEAIHTGIFPEIVRLENGPLCLVLIRAGMGAVMHENRVAYLSLRTPADTLRKLRGKALFASYTVQEDNPRAFRFVDPFGVTWQLVAD
jgi:catechol 2,3-dioxygenase-like lactoylglutathione lyase family enzyme